MGVVKNLMVRAGADFSAITKQANKAKTSMSGMQSSVSKSCARMSTAVSGMNKIFSTMGATISVAAIVAAGKSAKNAYDEQAEANAKLARVMANTMGARKDEVKSIEDYIDAQERLGVVTGDVQTQGAQELATYLTLSSSLKTLIPVMNDMVAQQYGIGASAESAVSIATMLGKVMNGQTSALSRYGYSFTKAQEEVLKFGTEAQRAAVLAEVVGESVGGMNAALAATPNGRLQQVSNTLGKIQESFGQAVSNIAVLFIPALNVVCSVLATLATLANKVAQAFANVFGSSASHAATAVSYTAAAAAGMGDLTEETEAAGKAAKGLSTFGFDTLQKMSSSTSGSGTDAGDASIGGVGGIAEMAAGTDEAGESIGWLEKGLTRLKEAVASLNFEKLTSPLREASDLLHDLGDLLSGNTSFSELISNLTPAQTAMVGIAAALGTIAAVSAGMTGLTAISTFFQSVKSLNAVGTIGKLAEVFMLTASGAGTLSEAMAAVFGPASVIAGIAGVIGGAVVAVTNFTSMMRNGFSWAQEALMLFGVALTAVGAIILGAPATVAGAVAAVVAAVATAAVVIKEHWTEIKAFGVSAWDGIKTAWSNVSSWFSSRVLTPLSSGFLNFANGVIGFFEGLVNGAISGVNSIIGAFNRISFTVPDWVPVIGGNSWGFDIETFPSISLPRLASGAVFEGNNPYMAIVNDQKHGVNVESPLSTIVEAMMIALNSVNFGDNIQVNVKAVFEGQLAALARLLRPYFEADAKRVGNKASTAKGVT